VKNGTENKQILKMAAKYQKIKEQIGKEPPLRFGHFGKNKNCGFPKGGNQFETINYFKEIKKENGKICIFIKNRFGGNDSEAPNSLK
jgi:hypothetical protein